MTTHASPISTAGTGVFRRWARRALAGALVASCLLAVIALVLAWRQSAAVGTLFADLDRWERAYPARGPDAAALRVEELASRLGAELAPLRAEGRAAADPAAAEEFAFAAGVAAEYLRGQLGREDAAIDPPDATLVSFLDRRAADLDALVAALADGPVPRWERRIKGIESVIAPRLIALMKLEHLLGVRTLTAVRRGDRAAALRDLRAFDRLLASLDGEPLLIDQLVVLALERRRLALLRRLPEIPVALIRRRDPAALRTMIDEALRFETASQAILARDLARVSRSGFEDRLIDPVRFPLTRWYARMCLYDGALAFERRRRQVGARPMSCLAVREDPKLSAPLALAAWNVFDDGAGLWPRTIDGALQRLSRLALEHEMTVLWAGLLDTADAGAPSVRRMASTTCPDGGAFMVERTSDGVLRVAWDGPLRPEPLNRPGIPLSQRRSLRVD